MQRYRVLTPLQHDGHFYRPGTVVMMAPDRARVPLANGTLHPLPIPGEGLAGVAVVDPELIPVLEGIRRLDVHERRYWTGNGRPRVRALAEVTGKAVTVQLRNRAWAHFLRERI